MVQYIDYKFTLVILIFVNSSMVHSRSLCVRKNYSSRNEGCGVHTLVMAASRAYLTSCFTRGLSKKPSGLEADPTSAFDFIRFSVFLYLISLRKEDLHLDSCCKILVHLWVVVSSSF